MAKNGDKVQFEHVLNAGGKVVTVYATYEVDEARGVVWADGAFYLDDEKNKVQIGSPKIQDPEKVLVISYLP